MIDAACFIATKLEAFASPTREHAGDLHASHDLEDVISIVDGRTSIVDEVAASHDEVRRFIVERFAALQLMPSFQHALVGHLGGDAERSVIVGARVREIAGLGPRP